MFLAQGFLFTQESTEGITSSETVKVVDSEDVPVYEYVPKVIIEGKWGRGPGEFGRQSDVNYDFKPESLAVDSKGNIYILDFVNNRIQKFDSSGKYLKSIEVDGLKGPVNCWAYESYDETTGETIRSVDSPSVDPSIPPEKPEGIPEDKLIPYIYPPEVQGINIVIDSKDNLYYYLKRIKDGKEVGEVWEFNDDKLVRKMKQGEEKIDKGYKTFDVRKNSNKDTEIIFEFENNKVFKFNPKLTKKISPNIKVGSKVQQPEVTKDLVIFFTFNKSDDLSDFNMTDRTTYVYDKKGNLKWMAIGIIPGKVDNEGNGYVMNIIDTGIIVKKFEKVRIK
jgi:hypothetical protein